jgi:drug/metabolite transporter (DMT)-like permease
MGAALLWGVTNLLQARAARRWSIELLAFWFVALQALVLVPPILVIVLTQPFPSGGELALAVAAGLVAALGMVVYGRALQLEDVAVAAPVSSLEGTVAASLAVLSGARPTAVAVAGIGLATFGALLVAGASTQSWRARGSAYALGASVLFGMSLWLIGQTSLDLITTLFWVSAAGAFAMAPAALATPTRRELPDAALGVAAAINLLGLACYTLGATRYSLSVTAVVAAQFAVVAVIGGVIFFQERLTSRELRGVAVLFAGVVLVAASQP